MAHASLLAERQAMDRDDLMLFAKIAGGVVLLVVALGLLAGLCTVPFNIQQCQIYSESGLETRWVVFGGCFVEVEPGYWINADDMIYWQGRLR